MNKTLKEAREKQGFSQAALAEMAGTSQPQIKRLESGERELTKTWAERLAPHLGIPPQSLLFDEAEKPSEDPGVYRPTPRFMDHQDLIPVYASAEGGNGHIIVSHDEIGRAPRPHVLDEVKDAYAILITGTSMSPAYKPGDRAWVNPTLPPGRETDCIFYAIDEELGEAKATIKEMVSWTDENWVVLQHNPSKTFKLDRKIWTRQHRVVGNFRRR